MPLSQHFGFLRDDAGADQWQPVGNHRSEYEGCVWKSREAEIKRNDEIGCRAITAENYDRLTSNLGVRGSNPFRRASIPRKRLANFRQQDILLPDAVAAEASWKLECAILEKKLLKLAHEGGGAPTGVFGPAPHPRGRL